MANTFPAQVPVPTERMVHLDTGLPVQAWFDFFAALWGRTGGSNASIDALLSTFPGDDGSLIGRFSGLWAAFEATVPNSILVMSPSVIQLLTASQLLDAVFGNTRGNIIFRGGAGWQVLAPVANGFFRSNGAGADPSYQVAASAPVSTAVSLTATGSVLGDALQLAAVWNQVTTVAAGTGVILPPQGVGLSAVVFNDGANALKVYPANGGAINVLAVNVPYSVPAGNGQFFFELVPNGWHTIIPG